MHEVPARRRRRLMWRAGTLAGAMAAVIGVGWAVSMQADPAPAIDTRTTIQVTTTEVATIPSTVPFFSGEPSQSLADAARDGVLPELAAVPFEYRVDPMLSVEAEEGTWVISELTEDLVDSPLAEEGCRLGALDSELSPICTVEYGELLLVVDGRIERAYPSPGAPLSWIHVAEEAVYGGRIGDGGLPNSTIMAVDRSTLEADGWEFVHHNRNEPVPGDRHIATGLAGERLHQLVGDADFPGQTVESWIGEVRIHLDGIRELFATGMAAIDPAGLVRVESMTRCGIDCVEVVYSPADEAQQSISDLNAALFGSSVTSQTSCADPSLFVYPAEDILGAFYEASGCDALLAAGRWAAVSPYFWLSTGGGETQLDQLDIIREELMAGACLGMVATDPPACRANEGAEAQLVYATIDSVSAEAFDVRFEVTAYQGSWDGSAYVLGGSIGSRTLGGACDAAANTSSGLDPAFYRITDLCGLAEQFSQDGAIPGTFEFLVGDEGQVLAASEIPVP